MNGNPDHPKEMIFHIATGVTDIPSLFLTPNLYFTLSHCHCHTHNFFFISIAYYFFFISIAYFYRKRRPKQDDLYTKKLSAKESIYKSETYSNGFI